MDTDFNKPKTEVAFYNGVPYKVCELEDYSEFEELRNGRGEINRKLFCFEGDGTLSEWDLSKKRLSEFKPDGKSLIFTDGQIIERGE